MLNRLSGDNRCLPWKSRGRGLSPGQTAPGSFCSGLPCEFAARLSQEGFGRVFFPLRGFLVWFVVFFYFALQGEQSHNAGEQHWFLPPQ